MTTGPAYIASVLRFFGDQGIDLRIGNTRIVTPKHTHVNRRHRSDLIRRSNPRMIKLAHFTAKWCVPCKMMEPTIEKFLTDHPDVTYEKIDVDLKKNEARCNTDHILSMPTLIMLANDTQIWRVNHVVGARALKNAYTKAKSAEEGT